MVQDLAKRVLLDNAVNTLRGSGAAEYKKSHTVDPEILVSQVEVNADTWKSIVVCANHFRYLFCNIFVFTSLVTMHSRFASPH